MFYPTLIKSAVSVGCQISLRLKLLFSKGHLKVNLFLSFTSKSLKYPAIDIERFGYRFILVLVTFASSTNTKKQECGTFHRKMLYETILFSKRMYL